MATADGATPQGADITPKGWPFKPPRSREEVERTRVLLARLLIKQAGILGHPVSDDVRRVAARPLPGRA